MALLALAGVEARADDWPYQAECRKFANVAIPQRDIGVAPAKCDSNILYYGATGDGHGSDFVASRACAYRERAAKEDVEFSGAMILTMIYANGLGVQRNLPLAKRFSCELDGAPAEMEGRLVHLDSIASKGSGKQRFDICDDITSGFMMGWCSAHEADFAKVRRDERMRALSRTWTPAQQSAFASLRKSADVYFDASAQGEIDLSGTARGMYETVARESLEEGFLAAIERFEKGNRPEPGATGFKSEDAGLNAAYKARLTEIAEAEKDGDQGTGAVTATGVREAQRKWLIYREAWVSFGAARYPAVPADAWRSWLSHERAAKIRNPEPDMEAPASH
ncbi:MAG TPA: hypothetical protein VGH80_00360 [Xanthomonadaceae bacterium]